MRDHPRSPVVATRRPRMMAECQSDPTCSCGRKGTRFPIPQPRRCAVFVFLRNCLRILLLSYWQSALPPVPGTKADSSEHVPCRTGPASPASKPWLRRDIPAPTVSKPNGRSLSFYGHCLQCTCHWCARIQAALPYPALRPRLRPLPPGERALRSGCRRGCSRRGP